MKFRESQDALTSTYAFVIAISIVSVSIFAVFQATDRIASPNDVQEAELVNLQSEAAALQRILLESPGIITGGGPWDEAASPSADDLIRIGLLDPTNESLQLEKLRNLRLAPYTMDGVDGFANYEEVHASLGLDDKGLDFHIRTRPTLRSAEDVLTDPSLRDPNLLVTYVASVESVTSGGGGVDDGLVVENYRCEAAPTGSPTWRHSIDITNGGLTTTQFLVVMDITGGDTITRQDQSAVVPAGDAVTVSVDVENVDGFTCDSSTTADIDVIDPLQLLRSSVYSNPTVGSAPAAATQEFYAVTGASNYLALQDVRLSYYGDVAKNDILDLEVREGTDPTNPLVYSTTESVPTSKSQQYIDIPGISLVIGDFTAYLTHQDSGVVATQHFTVSLADPAAYVPPTASGSEVYDEDEAVAIETQFLSDLVLQFCPTYYNDDSASPTGHNWTARCGFKNDLDPSVVSAQPGDIFPSLKTDLRELSERLLESDGVTPRYDITNTLVIGSNVAHNVMTDNLIDGPIETWVLGGGTLIVFGSPDQSTQWLQDLFHVGQTSSSGGISAPDVSHPLLSIPEPLAYEEYETSGYGWSYTSGAEESFTDVVVEGNTPVTAVSDPGDFGEGTVVLTSWMPYDLFGSGAGGFEGFRLIYNFISQGYRDLFVDYGPSIPEGVPAIPATGRSFVWHDDLGPITLDFTVYVFPSAS